MKKYKYYIGAIFAFVLIVYLITSHNSNIKNIALIAETENNILDYKINRNIEMSKSLINKKIKGIGEIVDSLEFKDSEAIVLLYNGYDCSSCIEAGFTMIKRLNSPYNLYVVAIQTNPSIHQKRYEYFDYIYLDDGDILRQELKFVPTPLMLVIDSTYKVKDAIAIDTFNGAEQRKFIERNVLK